MKNISLLAFVFLVFMSVDVSSQNQFLSIFEQKERPSTAKFKIDFTDSLYNETYLPIVIIKGHKTGPVFTVIAGVHGYEYPPIIAVQKLIKGINPNELKGTLIIVPITNTSSFYGRSPFVNPDDGVNLNRSFPGNANGTVTEQLANFISTEVIPVSDVFLDIHGGDANEDLMPFVCYYNNPQQPEQTQQASNLAEISGFEYVVKYPYTLKASEPAKYAFKQAVQDGKTALSIECGKLGNVQDKAVEAIERGVLNMLQELDMYKSTGQITTKSKELNKQFYLKSDQKGIFFSNHKSGEYVKKGDSAGYITDEFGTIISRPTIPESGIILYKIGTPPVNSGETIMCIASGS